MIFIRRLTLVRSSSSCAHYGGDYKQNKEDEEQDLRDPSGGSGDTSETKHCSDYCDDQKDQGPTKHVHFLLMVSQEGIKPSLLWIESR